MEYGSPKREFRSKKFDNENELIIYLAYFLENAYWEEIKSDKQNKTKFEIKLSKNEVFGTGYYGSKVDINKTKKGFKAVLNSLKIIGLDMKR